MRRVAGDGIDLAVWDAGDGPAVLLLHGFPDTHRLWRHQVTTLTGAGLRAIAPDLRGRGESGRPGAVEGYDIAHSVADMLCVLDELGVERAHVVGHDFGAVVAWVLAALHPDRVDHLIAIRRASRDRPPPEYRTAGEGLVHAALPVRGRRRAPAHGRRLAAVS